MASFANAAARTGRGEEEEEEEEEETPTPLPLSLSPPLLNKSSVIFRVSTLTTAEVMSGDSREGIGALSRSNRIRIGFEEEEEVEEVEEEVEEVEEIDRRFRSVPAASSTAPREAPSCSISKLHEAPVQAPSQSAELPPAAS